MMIDALLSAEDQETQEALDESLSRDCKACDGEGYDDEGEDCTECDGDGYIIHEPLGYWAVSRWLANKLSECGECIFEAHGLYIWGRCTSGQAIALDCVIQELANN